MATGAAQTRTLWGDKGIGGPEEAAVAQGNNSRRLDGSDRLAGPFGARLSVGDGEEEARLNLVSEIGKDGVRRYCGRVKGDLENSGSADRLSAHQNRCRSAAIPLSLNWRAASNARELARPDRRHSAARSCRRRCRE
jgi:hypothetical protein